MNLNTYMLEKIVYGLILVSLLFSGCSKMNHLEHSITNSSIKYEKEFNVTEKELQQRIVPEFTIIEVRANGT